MNELDYILQETLAEIRIDNCSDLRKSMYSAFHAHRSTAASRKVPFHLSFEEWAEIWLRSGCWAKRGKRSAQYVMGRIGDIGAYAVGNVKIITGRENVRSAQLGSTHSAEHIQKRTAHLKGRPKNPEHRAKLSAANKGKKPWNGHGPSAETARKLSDNLKARWASGEIRAAQKRGRELRSA